MSWYTDIKTWIANNIRTNHQREITGAKMNTVLNNIVDEVDRKVDKVSGKGLSTNDYNNTEKAKVANAYSKPSGGIPKTDLATAVQTSLGKADTAVQTETDPTVPSWAKAHTKPTYTASEVGAIPAADKGANGGVATLDNAGKVPQSQLPSYVDDVLEYANLASFPATGESGKIYVALDTNKTYRWSGSAYVEISQSLALGETSSTAFPGDRGKAIEDKIPSNASSSNKLATKAEMVPAGGTTGQVLAKRSNTDNDLEWVNQSGGGGGTSDYEDLTNKPQINSVTLNGNKTASDLGLATATQGAKADTAVQPTDGVAYVGEVAGSSSSADFNAQSDTVWNKAQVLSSAQQAQARANIGAGTSNFSGSYNDLSDKPTIPDAVSGVDDGTNWTSITIGNTTKAIPSGGGGGGGEANVIESISINGTTQTVISKNVDLPVPTSTAVYQIVSISQSAYDALVSGGTVSSTTLYLITS